MAANKDGHNGKLFMINKTLQKDSIEMPSYSFIIGTMTSPVLISKVTGNIRACYRHARSLTRL